MSGPDAGFDVEESLWTDGATWVCGVDEVGRGAWAGPLLVCAGAVRRVDMASAPVGLNDSKVLRAARREELSALISAWAPVGSGWVHAEEIDEVGMAAALRLAASRALDDLRAQGVRVDAVIQDGSSAFVNVDVPLVVKTKADASCASVAAASIVAKVARDAWMREHGAAYPQHPALASSAGYGTRAHAASLLEHGVTPLHRVSFRIPGRDRATAPGT